MDAKKLPSVISSALMEVKQALSQLYGDRLQGLYLYGSYARGSAHEGSDVDILVVLTGAISPGAEISRMNPIISAICLRYDILISLYPIASEQLSIQYSPFLENVRREAVLL